MILAYSKLKVRCFTRSKYGNTTTEQDGYSFASKLEASVYQLLKLRAKALELQILQTQAQDHILPCITLYLSDARIGYIPDFKCLDLKNGTEFFVEAKGYETAKWPLIKKLWKAYGPAPLEIWKGHYLNPSLDDIIIPRELKIKV